MPPPEVIDRVPPWVLEPVLDHLPIDHASAVRSWIIDARHEFRGQIGDDENDTVADQEFQAGVLWAARDLRISARQAAAIAPALGQVAHSPDFIFDGRAWDGDRWEIDPYFGDQTIPRPAGETVVERAVRREAHIASAAWTDTGSLQGRTLHNVTTFLSAYHDGHVEPQTPQEVTHVLDVLTAASDDEAATIWSQAQEGGRRWVSQPDAVDVAGVAWARAAVQATPPADRRAHVELFTDSVREQVTSALWPPMLS